MRGLVVIVGLVLLIGVGVTDFVKSVSYDRAIGGHLKRAADANTVELARQELSVALRNMEERGLTSGYTSILYRTPDEDIGFWYANIKSSYQELETLSAEATGLERSNMLMKLRETLLDKDSHGEDVTAPEGIHKYPNNTTFALFYLFALVLLVGGAVAWELDR